jgi:hypothetical protein
MRAGNPCTVVCKTGFPSAPRIWIFVGKGLLAKNHQHILEQTNLTNYSKALLSDANV